MRYLLSNSILNLIAFNCIPNAIFNVEQKNHLLYYFDGNCKEILCSKLQDLYHIIRKRNRIDFSFDNCFRKAEVLFKKYRHSIASVLDHDYGFAPYFSSISDYRLLPPYLLYYQGNLQLLKIQKKISVVGTRYPHHMSEQFTNFIVSSIKKTTVSGFAKGIDRQVHMTSLKNRIPTIAVWGNGIDILYPKENLGLYKAFINSENTLIISEYPPDTLPKKELFPLRNRIIALLGDYCILIQSSIPSGAIITCRYAKKFNREVFVFYPTQMKGFEGNAKVEKEFNGIKIYGIKNGKLLIEHNTNIFENSEFRNSKKYMLYNNKNFSDTADIISKLPKDHYFTEVDKYIGNYIFNNPGCNVSAIMKTMNAIIGDNDVLSSLTRLLSQKKIWMDCGLYYPFFE